jgi:large subunit ribosomal protein L15
MPLQRRVPKRGFTNIFRKHFAIVNVGRLSLLPPQSQVNAHLLEARGFIKGRRDGVKVLGKGELSVALTVEADAFSASARRKIEAAGGQAVVTRS